MSHEDLCFSGLDHWISEALASPTKRDVTEGRYNESPVGLTTGNSRLPAGMW